MARAQCVEVQQEERKRKGGGEKRGKEGGGGMKMQIRKLIMTGRVRLIALNCIGSIHESRSASRLEIEPG